MNFYEKMKEFFSQNRKFCGVIIGLIVGILILTINFWRTLLLVVCALIGWLLFGSANIKEKVYRLAEKFFSKSKF